MPECAGLGETGQKVLAVSTAPRAKEVAQVPKQKTVPVAYNGFWSGAPYKPS